METQQVEGKSAFLSCQLAHDGLFDNEMMMVEMTFLRNPESDADVDFYASVMESVYGKNKGFTILFDASGLTSIPMKYLNALKKRMDETADKQDQLMVASAALLPQGALMKLIHKLFLRKTTDDRKICSNVTEARAFLTAIAHQPK